MSKPFETFLEAWRRQRDMTSAPENLVAGPHCVMIAEVEALLTRQEPLSVERAQHADNCPYCQRTIRLFEETLKRKRDSQRFFLRPYAWLFSTAGIAAAGLCLFLLTAPGRILGPDVPRLEPLAGRARGPVDAGTPVPASAKWSRQRSLVVSWQPVPGATGYRVILYPDGDKGIPRGVTGGSAASLSVPWNDVPHTERIVFEVRALGVSP